MELDDPVDEPGSTRSKRTDAQKAANLEKWKERKAALKAKRDKTAAENAELAKITAQLASLGVGGRRRTRKQKRKGKKHPRKTRRGGILPQRMTLMEKVKMLTKKRNDIDNDPNSTPEEKDAALKEWSDAYEQLKSQLGRPDDPLFYHKLNDYLNRP